MHFYVNAIKTLRGPATKAAVTTLLESSSIVVTTVIELSLAGAF